jgi:hypothetical protein
LDHKPKTTQPVHLGDTEIVDGVIVHDGQVVPWSQAAVVAGALVVAVGTAVAGAVVVAARRKARAQ